ncbi:MAG: bacteriocin [Selenomonadaceae bacterium]|nr:bacteriocin [Selenomonadaceae bacterium]
MSEEKIKNETLNEDELNEVSGGVRATVYINKHTPNRAPNTLKAAELAGKDLYNKSIDILIPAGAAIFGLLLSDGAAKRLKEKVNEIKNNLKVKVK